MVRTVEEKVIFGDNGEAARIFGQLDGHLTLMEREFPVQLAARGNTVTIRGEEETVSQVRQVFGQLTQLARQQEVLTSQDVLQVIGMVKKGRAEESALLSQEVILHNARGKAVRPRTNGQKAYLQAIQQHDVVFGIGPAGTGKTYLAVVMAVLALRRREVSRLILTRPAVEAGEKLGFLPGDLQEKVDPYLRPLYDALYDLLGQEITQRYLEKGIIEVAPLAYMRGRTLEDSFIILDEAQNTTPEQMKMFLTRLGLGSRAVITGDITQIDLPRGQFSGLVEVQQILRGIEGISFCYLTEADVVRHPLVQRIVEAYRRRNERSE